MATPEPDRAVVALLEALTTPTALTEGQNLFVGPMDVSTGIGSLAVFVVPTGGREHYRFQGSSADWRAYTVQVTVRAGSGPREYAAGLTLARACRDVCHCPETMPENYTECRVREPDPNYLRVDTGGRHVFGFNVELAVAV